VSKDVEGHVAYPFPSPAWVQALISILNSDNRYAEIARNWEGDLVFAVEPDDDGQSNDPQAQVVRIYLDLWHGKCRDGYMVEDGMAVAPPAKYVLSALRSNFLRILSGELDAMQAMLTRRLRVDGSMAYMLRNVPTVLDFVRCTKRVEITDSRP